MALSRIRHQLLQASLLRLSKNTAALLLNPEPAYYSSDSIMFRCGPTVVSETLVSELREELLKREDILSILAYADAESTSESELLCREAPVGIGSFTCSIIAEACRCLHLKYRNP